MAYNGRDYLKSNEEYLQQVADLYNTIVTGDWSISCKARDWYIKKYFSKELEAYDKAVGALTTALTDHIEKLQKELNK